MQTKVKMTKIECPVCGESFSPQGIQTHLDSHTKKKIVSGVCDRLKTDGEINHEPQECKTDQVEEITTKAETAVEQIRRKSNNRRDKIGEKAAQTLTNDK